MKSKIQPRVLVIECIFVMLLTIAALPSVLHGACNMPDGTFATISISGGGGSASENCEDCPIPITVTVSPAEAADPPPAPTADRGSIMSTETGYALQPPQNGGEVTVRACLSGTGGDAECCATLTLIFQDEQVAPPLMEGVPALSEDEAAILGDLLINQEFETLARIAECRDKAEMLAAGGDDSLFDPGGCSGDGSVANAFKHMYYSCCLTQVLGSPGGKALADAHENHSGNDCSTGNPQMDYSNNEAGANAAGGGDCKDSVIDAMRDGSGTWMSDKGSQGCDFEMTGDDPDEAEDAVNDCLKNPENFP